MSRRGRDSDKAVRGQSLTMSEGECRKGICGQSYAPRAFCPAPLPTGLRRATGRKPPEPRAFFLVRRSDILSGADAHRDSALPPAVKRPIRVVSSAALDGRRAERATIISHRELREVAPAVATWIARPHRVSVGGEAAD